MKILTVWLLVVVGNGAFNAGNVTVIGKFATPEACRIAGDAIANNGVTPKRALTAVCVEPLKENAL